MSKRLEQLARRKAILIGQCAYEREEISRLFTQIRLPFNLGGLLLGLSRTLSAHPAIAAGISGLLVSGYAGRLTKSVVELLKLWRLAHPLWSWWSKRRTQK